MKDSTKKKWFVFKFWFLSLTWGLPLSLVGFLITGFCILIGGKPHKNGCSYIVEIGSNWGGLECGPVALCGSYSQKDKGCYNPSWYEHTRKHEFGHSSSQFIYMGVFFLFIVAIPSAIRYWYQRIAQKHGKTFPSDWYDSIWFEGMATKKGTQYVEWLEKTNN